MKAESDEVQLRRQGHSQVQLGNEGKGGFTGPGREAFRRFRVGGAWWAGRPPFRRPAARPCRHGPEKLTTMISSFRMVGRDPERMRHRVRRFQRRDDAFRLGESSWKRRQRLVVGRVDVSPPGLHLSRDYVPAPRRRNPIPPIPNASTGSAHPRPPAKTSSSPATRRAFRPGTVPRVSGRDYPRPRRRPRRPPSAPPRLPKTEWNKPDGVASPTDARNQEVRQDAPPAPGSAAAPPRRSPGENPAPSSGRGASRARCRGCRKSCGRW